MRLCENKLDIIRRVLEACPEAYRQSEKVGGEEGKVTWGGGKGLPGEEGKVTW